MKRKRKIPGRARFGAAIAMSALPVDDASKGVWNALAYAVAMESGVTLTRQDFEDCVRNFGKYPKVPLVVEHADTEAFGNAAWAEPHGWIVALRVGEYARPDGTSVASLEGRIRADAATRLAINGDDDNPPKWPFGSVTVYTGTDEETGAELGTCLWSFSLTAHPRLVDVPKLAAGKRLEGAVEAGYWYGDVDSREDVLSMLRSVLDLPVTSSEADALASLARLGAMATEGDAAGVDLTCILRQLRDALRLPALTTTAEVIAEVRKALDVLPSETAASDDADLTTMSRGAAASPNGETMKTFLEMAAKLGLRAATEDEARAALEAHARIGGELVTALGATAPGDAPAKLSALQAEAAKLPALSIELAALKKDADARADGERTAYVDDLLATDEYTGLSEPRAKSVRASFELHAKHDWKGFQEAHPIENRAEVRRNAAAEKVERGQDGERFRRVAGADPTVPRENGAVHGRDYVSAAKSLMDDAAGRGEHLSFADALDALENDADPNGSERGPSAPADLDD